MVQEFKEFKDFEDFKEFKDLFGDMRINSRRYGVKSMP
jgi:hypothetical protein